MIIETGDKTHPKAEILLIDFKSGKIDFRWLEADEAPSKIYSGDCSMTVDVKDATTLEDAQTLLESGIVTEAGLQAEIALTIKE